MNMDISPEICTFAYEVGLRFQSIFTVITRWVTDDIHYTEMTVQL